MRRIAAIALAAIALNLIVGGVGSATRMGVAPGTPVHVHTHNDNGIVSAVRTAAQRVGLGSVEAVGFERNCKPMPNYVLVCRDASLERPGSPTATSVGAGWCVVRLEPTLGPGTSSVRLVTAAFRLCLA